MLPAVQAVPRRDVAFGRELGRPVRREGLERVILACRPLALAVDRAPGGGEDDLRTLLLGGLEDVDRADHVVHRVLVGSRDGDADIGLRCEVEARVGTEVREDVAERLADVPLHELGAAGTCSRSPRERLSITRTSSPRASSASARCEPMKPAPPVTIARTLLS